MVTLHVHFFNGTCADYDVSNGWHWSTRDGVALLIIRRSQGAMFSGVLRMEIPAVNIQHIQIERHG